MKLFDKLPFIGKPKASTLANPERWMVEGLGGQPTASGIVVNADTALRLSGVYACVRVISESIASLPINVYKKTTTGKELDDEHPLTKVLRHRPNPEHTPMQMKEMSVAATQLVGNSYCAIARNGGGQVAQLWPLVGSVKPERTSSGELIFRHTDLQGNQRTYQRINILHVAGLSFDGVKGLSPIAYQREAFGNAAILDRTVGSTFGNNAVLPGVLTTEQKLTEQAYQNIAESWKAKHQDPNNSGKIAILEGGLKYQQLSLNMKDAQFIEGRKMSLGEIARIFRVPPHMIGDLDKATFSNIEHQGIEFVVHTIRPWLTRIEESMERDLLTEQELGEVFIRFDVDHLLRGDSKGRAEYYAAGIKDAWLNPNEVREREGLNPYEGGDEYRSQLNMESVNANDDDDEEEDEPIEQEDPTPVEDRLMKFVRANAKRINTKEVAILKNKKDHTEKVSQLLDLTTDVRDWLHIEEDDAIEYIATRIELLNENKNDLEQLAFLWQQAGGQDLVKFINAKELT